MRTWSGKSELAGGETFAFAHTASGEIQIFRETSPSGDLQSINIDRLGGMVGSFEPVFSVDPDDSSLPYYEGLPSIQALDVVGSGNALFVTALAIGTVYEDEDRYYTYYSQDNYNAFQISSPVDAPLDGTTLHQQSTTTSYLPWGDRERHERSISAVETIAVSEDRLLSAALYHDEDRYEPAGGDEELSESDELRIVNATAGGGAETSFVLDVTPASGAQLFTQDNGTGAVWVNGVGAGSVVLSLASFDGDGELIGARSTRLSQDAFAGLAKSSIVEIGDAVGASDGGVFLSVRFDDGFYFARFDASFRLVGLTQELPAEQAEVRLVGLPTGGFVSLVDASGEDQSSLYLQQYTEAGDRIGEQLRLSSSASAEIVDVAALDDGRIVVVWNENGRSFEQIVDTRDAGVNETGGARGGTLVGTAFVDVLLGAEEADRIAGGAGDDRLYGGGGNDVLVGGLGADKLAGGAGHDIVRFETAVQIDLDSLAANKGEAAGDVYSSIEQFRGSLFDDKFFGDATANVFEGRSGADALVGRGGADTLIGGDGDDRLTGGSGADVFRFNGGEMGVDTIRDFTHGVDKIGVLKSGFHLTSVAVVANGDPSAATAAPTFLFDTDSHLLSFDADGSGGGAAFALATLVNVTTLVASDFFLI